MLIGSQLGNKLCRHTSQEPMLRVVGNALRVTMTPMFENFVLQTVWPRPENTGLQQFIRFGIQHSRRMHRFGRKPRFFGQLAHSCMQGRFIWKIKAAGHRLPVTGFVSPFYQ